MVCTVDNSSLFPSYRISTTPQTQHSGFILAHFSTLLRRLTPLRHPSTSLVVPSVFDKVPGLSNSIHWCQVNLNFYRIHLLTFSLLPLVIGGVFYASNGSDYPVGVIDAFHVSYAAQTVTGLNTVLLARLTTWQQVLLFIQMLLGSTSTVSIITIIVRRQAFKRKFKHLIQTSPAARKRVNALAQDSANIVDDAALELQPTRTAQSLAATSFTPMVAPVLSDEPDSMSLASSAPHVEDDAAPSPRHVSFPPPRSRTASTPRTALRHVTLVPPSAAPPSPTVSEFPPRSRPLHEESALRHRTRRVSIEEQSEALTESSHRQSMTYAPRRPVRTRPADSALTAGFGGFPNPLLLAAGAISRQLQPRSRPSIISLESSHSGATPKLKPKPTYLTFEAQTGRNSKFKGLTSEQQEELGGVEYRALTLLLQIMVTYWLLSQFLAILALAPWLANSGTYAPLFASSNNVNPTWFTTFQVVSAYSNCGLSLIDASMVPFSDAYWLMVVMGVLTLMGNTALPIFLRFTIWTLSKLVPSRSQTRETLQFLLDHPRRCFIYLFPSHQTWYLLSVLVLLNSFDWFAFLVLDIGDPEIDAIPIAKRVAVGLYQAVSVRTTGFNVIPLQDIAPALQVLYLAMFQIATYPVAIAVRSTNVYEQKSLGIYRNEEDEEDVEAKFDKAGKEHAPGTTTSYIAHHVRSQLGFDMWSLVFALWLICIVERANILSGDKPWITIFSLLFEVSSSYGNVGLSLRTPQGDLSLVGVLRPLSKVVLIFTMIRGRHRGLPQAIDRAVLLPKDDEDEFGRRAAADPRASQGEGERNGTGVGVE